MDRLWPVLFCCQVRGFMRRLHYDAQIAELGQKLAQVSDACEAHIRIATQVDQLLLSAGNEIAELALAL